MIKVTKVKQICTFFINTQDDITHQHYFISVSSCGRSLTRDIKFINHKCNVLRKGNHISRGYCYI